MTVSAPPQVVPVEAADGARSDLLWVPAGSHAPALYWLPAMGVPARYYLDFATALAAHGVSVALHEWRGLGSSDRRAGRRCDWGYRQLLHEDIPAGLVALRERAPASIVLAGHSLGGQLAMVYAGLARQQADGVVLVASGAPWWRAFPAPLRFALYPAYALAPVLADLVGHFPGRRLGFGGREARGVIHDWAASGRSGRYAARGIERDLEAAMRDLRQPMLALRLQDDWFGPGGSLGWLLGKVPHASRDVQVLGTTQLGCRADHFSWIRQPGVVAERIADWVRGNRPPA